MSHTQETKTLEITYAAYSQHHPNENILWHQHRQPQHQFKTNYLIYNHLH